MSKGIQIGHLLRSGITGFIAGCRITGLEAPSFGALVRVPITDEYQVFGLIHDIHIDDDGLVRQLVTTEAIDASVIADNRTNRNVPLEISVVVVGYMKKDTILHLLPPKPPLSLDLIYLCTADEIREFTSVKRFSYLRHIIRAQELPLGELLAAHILQVSEAHEEAGNGTWGDLATKEIITLLRDDYPKLMEVLNALASALPA